MITFEPLENCVYVTALDETIIFARFTMFCYSNDFAVAAAICGRSRENQIYLIDIWEPGKTSLPKWADKWAEKLRRIGPIRGNETGEAAAQLLGGIGKPGKRGRDISPIELQLNIHKINGSLYQGWERIVELSNASVSRRETNVTGGAVLGAAKMIGRGAICNTRSVFSKPRSEARRRGHRMPRGVML